MRAPTLFSCQTLTGTFEGIICPLLQRGVSAGYRNQLALDFFTFFMGAWTWAMREDLAVGG